LSVTSGELIRLLEDDGWYCVRQRASHAIYRHAQKPGQLTVPVHKGKEVPTGTLNSILKAAGLK
jgi:predicted RNA binding protein YcfA (HicA-like mRNA interferase family)